MKEFNEENLVSITKEKLKLPEHKGRPDREIFKKSEVKNKVSHYFISHYQIINTLIKLLNLYWKTLEY